MTVRQKMKRTQNKNPSQPNGRDMFQTPNDATNLLLPYIPNSIYKVWEPACGQGKIVDILYPEFTVFYSDVSSSYNVKQHNFLCGGFPFSIYDFDCNIDEHTAIITNPPFSLKKEFAYKCLEYGLPWALLIPFDISGWVCDLIENHNVQFLLPSRRINYITPTGLSEASGHTANFHSVWMTYKFNLPKQITVVELTKEMMKDI